MRVAATSDNEGIAGGDTRVEILQRAVKGSSRRLESALNPSVLRKFLKPSPSALPQLLEHLSTFLEWQRARVTPYTTTKPAKDSEEVKRNAEDKRAMLLHDRQSEEHEYDDFDAPPGHTETPAVLSPLSTPEPPPSPTPSPAESRDCTPASNADVNTVEEAGELPSEDAATKAEATPAPAAAPSAAPTVTAERHQNAVDDDEDFDDWVVTPAAQEPEWLAPKPVAQPSIETTNRFATLPVDQLHDESAEPAPAPKPPRVMQQGKKRTKPFAPAEPAPDISSTIKLAALGRLFKHQCSIRGADLDFKDVMAIVDSGAEVVAIDAALFEAMEGPLGLKLVTNELFGVTMANNTSHRTVGRCRVRLRVGESETEIDARVIDSAGAFDVLLGKPWLAAAQAIMFCEVDCDCIMYPQPLSESYGKLWNQNPRATPTFVDLPDDLELVARWCMERHIRRVLNTTRRGDLVGQIQHDDDERQLTESEADAAARRVLLMELEQPLAEFWANVECREAPGQLSAIEALPLERVPRPRLAALPAAFVQRTTDQVNESPCSFTIGSELSESAAAFLQARGSATSERVVSLDPRALQDIMPSDSQVPDAVWLIRDAEEEHVKIAADDPDRLSELRRIIQVGDEDGKNLTADQTKTL